MKVGSSANFALAAILFSAPTIAGVYKCQDAQGNITYSQSPCPQAKVEKVRIYRGPEPIRETAPNTEVTKDGAPPTYEEARAAAETARNLAEAKRLEAETEARQALIDRLRGPRQPAKFSYDDQIKIENIERRLQRATSDVEIRAARLELSVIYRKYGLPAP